ncbi:MAG: response regulator, partial [Cyanobacteria bacterium J06641_5]
VVPTVRVDSTFTLQLPLTLNISKLMICEAGGMKYSLLSDTIEKIISPNPDDLSFHEGQQVLHWQSGTGIETIPVRYLRDLVSYTGRGRRPEPQPKHEPSQAIAILLLRSKGDLLGLAIDRVLGEQELVIRPLGSTFVPPPYAYGCSILPDGKLSLVIDPLTLIASQPGDVAHKPNISGTLNILDRDPELPLAAPAAPEEDRPTVATEPELFIIDDSPNARLSLAMSLKKAGYTIHEAEDGLDALEKLKQLNNIGLILCDIDMPRMNGVEFLMARQKEPALKNIPVAMLTSHNAQKYRQLASSLGASAYFTKPYRDEKVLPKVGELLGKPVANPV